MQTHPSRQGQELSNQGLTHPDRQGEEVNSRSFANSQQHDGTGCHQVQEMKPVIVCYLKAGETNDCVLPESM